jgi:hypothetical protein
MSGELRRELNSLSQAATTSTSMEVANLTTDDLVAYFCQGCGEEITATPDGVIHVGSGLRQCVGGWLDND